MALAQTGAGSMTTRDLVEAVADAGEQFARVTLVGVIKQETHADDGVLSRLRPGVYALRKSDDTPATQPRPARAWVLDVLTAQAAQGQAAMTRREVEAVFEADGLRYTRRAISAALTALVRDPASSVFSPRPGAYQADMAAVAPEGA